MISRGQTTKDASTFYDARIADLGVNLKDLENIVHGKSGNLRVVEDGTLNSMISASF